MLETFLKGLFVPRLDRVNVKTSNTPEAKNRKQAWRKRKGETLCLAFFIATIVDYDASGQINLLDFNFTLRL